MGSVWTHFVSSFKLVVMQRVQQGVFFSSIGDFSIIDSFRWKDQCDAIVRLEKARDEAARDVTRDGVKIKYPEVQQYIRRNRIVYQCQLFMLFYLQPTVTLFLVYSPERQSILNQGRSVPLTCITRFSTMLSLLEYLVLCASDSIEDARGMKYVSVAVTLFVLTFTPAVCTLNAICWVSSLSLLEQKWSLSGVQLEEFQKAASLRSDLLESAERDLKAAFAGKLEACQAIAAWENNIPPEKVCLRIRRTTMVRQTCAL